MRVVMYARGPEHAVAWQLTRCLADIERHGDRVTGLAQDGPDSVEGWADAMRMVEAGEVDVIVVASTDVIPPPPGVRVAVAGPPLADHGQRRTRRIG